MPSREEIINSLNACMDVHQSGLWSSGCMLCAYEKQSNPKCFMDLTKDVIELLKHDEQTIASLQSTINKLTKALAEKPEQKFFVDSDGKITPLPIQPQWHPFNPVEPDDTGLKDHNFYLVTVKGFGTPMKAMYHIDMPFGFTPPPTKDFDPYDVIAWRELPDNMDEEVKQDA